MLIKLCKRRGQNTAEYAILIGVIVAAAIAMQVYVRRGMQGRVKDAVDLTRNADPAMFNISQYEPYYANSSFASNQSSRSGESLLAQGALNRTSDDDSSRAGHQTYDSWENSN